MHRPLLATCSQVDFVFYQLVSNFLFFKMANMGKWNLEDYKIHSILQTTLMPMKFFIFRLQKQAKA